MVSGARSAISRAVVLFITPATARRFSRSLLGALAHGIPVLPISPRPRRAWPYAAGVHFAPLMMETLALAPMRVAPASIMANATS